jgi:hypothetical protein
MNNIVELNTAEITVICGGKAKKKGRGKRVSGPKIPQSLEKAVGYAYEHLTVTGVGFTGLAVLVAPLIYKITGTSLFITGIIALTLIGCLEEAYRTA